MTTDELVQKYWNYYLMLEQRLLETRNFVEFRNENFNTSSNEFGLLIVAIGAELDNFLKTYCEIPEGDRNSPRVNMGTYCGYLSAHYPQIANETITVLDTDPVITLTPFACFNSPDRFLWWNAYNQVKHNRHVNFAEANLINAITLLSALFLLEMKMFKNIYNASTGQEHVFDRPLNQSKLFKLNNWTFNCISGSELVAVPAGPAVVRTVTHPIRYT